MAVNKVEFGDQVVMDITDSTVSPEKLLSGETAYDKSGAKITGSLVTKDIAIETKRSTGENIATISLDNTDYDIYALSEEEVADFLSGDQEVEGNPVALKTLIGGDAKACSVDLEPIQDLHGYDSPWVGGAGKNKLTFTEANIKAQNPGVTWTNNTATVNGGTFTILTDSDGNTVGVNAKGTFTAQTTLMVSDYMTLTAGDLLNGCPSGSSSTYGLGLEQIGIIQYSGTDHAITPGEASQQRRVYIRIASGENLGTNGVDFKPMLRLSSVSDNSFAPYSNICPISGRTQASVTRTGKNIWDEEWELGGISSSTGANTSSNTTIRSKNYTRVYSGLNYYVYKKEGIGAINGRFYDKNKNYIGYGSLNQETTFSENVAYIRFQVSNMTEYKDGICIAISATPITYEPYQSETVTVSFGQTVYGGTLDLNAGRLMIDKEYRLLNGSENWTVISSGTESYFYSLQLPSTSYAVSSSIISNMFPQGTISSSTTTVGIVHCTGGYIRVRPFDTELSVADWKTWLQSNIVQVVFGIQTPIEIDLTAEQISLLKGNNVVSTDGDNIDITWQNIPDIEDITPIKPLDYSTSEQATGQKWIDGSDIYRRTFTGTIDSNTHGTTEIADFTDLQPIACNGWFMDTSGVGMALGYFPNSTSWASALHIDSNHKLLLFTESALASGTYYVTVDYIKTT